MNKNNSRTALVLGGGGSTGNAWLIGVIAGLFEAGLDVTKADLVIGTSAGATAAAQIVGVSPSDLFAAAIVAVPRQLAGPATPGLGRAAVSPTMEHLERFQRIIASSEDAADMRRRMSEAALERDAASDGSWGALWRATVAARIPGAVWPERRMLITAVDARTSEPVVFDRDSGVDVVDAVAASTSGGGFSYGIGDDRYIDGGYRSNAENADLASGYERVLMLSPFGGRSLYPREWGVHLATQVEALRADGSSVETVFPRSESEHLFGSNAMNVSLRPEAARAGYGQGSARAEELTQFWG